MILFHSFRTKSYLICKAQDYTLKCSHWALTDCLDITSFTFSPSNQVGKNFLKPREELQRWDLERQMSHRCHLFRSQQHDSRRLIIIYEFMSLWIQMFLKCSDPDAGIVCCLIWYKVKHWKRSLLDSFSVKCCCCYSCLLALLIARQTISWPLVPYKHACKQISDFL